MEMKWQPITEAEIRGELNSACVRMSIPQRRLWEAIRINPEKWKLEPWGNEGGGFWVVGIMGKTVVWYNDIEDGFNRSVYTTYGKIDQYWCNQDRLEWTIQYIIDAVESGKDTGTFLGPPQPID